RRFRFAPPAGAKVTELARSAGSGAGRHVGAAQQVTTPGSGWRTVATVRPGHKQLAALRKSPVLSSLTPVSGSWGSGYLLDSDLLSALLTADGRLLVGAVPPADLYAAAGRK
ncbi:MAG TPA: hypothetical protein VHC23_05510, partial [Jatrophihabitans sp.]|nr:hypothetical protein [Jatrophihabitans sp.]